MTILIVLVALIVAVLLFGAGAVGAALGWIAFVAVLGFFVASGLFGDTAGEVIMYGGGLVGLAIIAGIIESAFRR